MDQVFSTREASNKDGTNEHAQVRALISEIWMLVDYIAGSPTQGLNKVQVPNPNGSGANLTADQLLQCVSETERRLSIGGHLNISDRAHMQIVRDALNLLVFPASGLTVAYTTMVAGPLRGRAASRFSLAKEAYANLPGRAKAHRRWQSVILVLTIIVTGMAVWESAKVALGKALLQNLEMLRTEQVALSHEKVKLELTLATTASTTSPFREVTNGMVVPLTSYRLCDRALVFLALNNRSGQASDKNPLPQMPAYATAEERDVCGRDDILRVNLGIVRQDLRTYTENWPGMVGSGFAIIRNLVVCRELSCPVISGNSLQNGQNDIEFRVAPMLLVWGNFVLPIIFGFIGSAIFVTLDHYNKIRDSLLRPRDYSLAPVRLALGLVVGACIGLFFSAYGPVPQYSTTANATNLISSLTLTASGVAFLAGFGVETVFAMLETLITRLFVAPTVTR